MARKPKYRRHTTRNLGFVEFNGRRHYFSGAYKSPESLREYADFLRRNVPSVVIGKSPPSASTTKLWKLSELFLDWAEATYPVAARSEYANVQAAVKLLLAREPRTLAIDFGPLRLKAFQASLAKTKKSRGYINAVCARIKRMFKWAVSEELLPGESYSALAAVPGLRKGRTPAVEPAKRRPVQWDDVAPVLAELSPTVRAMVLAQWHTGVRSQSLCYATASQFDMTCQPWEWRPKHKTEHLDHTMIVFVGPQAQAVLAPFLKGKPPGEFLFQPKTPAGKRAKRYRSFYDSVSYLRAVSRAIDRINRKIAEDNEGKPEDQRRPLMQHWTPHQLRHAKATIVRAQHGLEAAQAALGHSTLDATQLYARAQAELARKVAAENG